MSDTTTSAISENVYYKNGKTAENQQPSENLLKQTQEKADELVEILHDNFAKVLEREEKLSDLNERAEVLVEGASEFKTQTILVKRKEWRKRMKTKLVFAGILAVLLIIIILIIIQTFAMK